MKYEILEMLREAAPGFVSGEVISKRLGVTRTAIWKHIRELKEEGYGIGSSSRKGYCLESAPAGLNGFEIRSGLENTVIGREVLYLEETESTNTVAKTLAGEGAVEGTVVVAGRQTAGRGRLGRTWESPVGTGLYMTVILRPSVAPEEVQFITLAASVAVVAAIRNTTGLEAGIKWPNDIVLGGKKVCGILTEMNSEMERVNFLVLGMGINVSQRPEDFPEELRDKATSLDSYARGMADSGSSGHESGPVPGPVSRLALARAVLAELDRVYAMVLGGRRAEIIKEWKSHSQTLGREVRVIYKERELTGKAEDITEEGRLVLQDSDGVRREILSGEVSVRGLLGYI